MPQADIMYIIYVTATITILVLITYGMYFCHFNKETIKKYNLKEYCVFIQIKNWFNKNI